MCMYVLYVYIETGIGVEILFKELVHMIVGLESL